MAKRKLVSLAECPIGMFKYGSTLALKTEYRTDGSPDCYIVSSGEYFWGGTTSREDHNRIMVRPVHVVEARPRRQRGK